MRRFSDFQAHLDIPRAVLSDRLGGLVEDGVLARRPDPEHRGRHLYELTAAGRELWPVVYAMLTWGARHRSPNGRVFSHAACGTASTTAARARMRGRAEPGDVVTSLRPGPAGRDDPVAVALREPHRLLEPVATRPPG